MTENGAGICVMAAGPGISVSTDTGLLIGGQDGAVEIEWWQQAAELQFVQVWVVIINAESGTHHGTGQSVVCDANTRRPVVLVGMDDSGRVEVILVDDVRQ